MTRRIESTSSRVEYTPNEAAAMAWVTTLSLPVATAFGIVLTAVEFLALT